MYERGYYETKSGKKVEVLAIRENTVIGWCEGEVETWSLNGRYLHDGTESGWDLLPAKSTGSEAA